MNRDSILREISNSTDFDFLVIGGGATGLGVAVDAATRGLRTLLLEARDFAHGTSGRSTKLVHGGVRYLEQGDIPLVLEALRERGLLHRNAPHIVHHLSFIVPRYKWWEGPFYGLGLKVYDALAGRLNLSPSRMLSREETIARIPNIEQEHLLGGVEYFDGQFDDARLAITLARTAHEHGALLLNYAPVVSLLKSNGIVSGATFRDAETGEKFTVRARVVINATGIFTDQIRQMDDPESARCVQPSQGVHLVFGPQFLRGDSAIMVPHTDDGRVLFVIPWHGHVLVGTTDTAMDEPQEEPRALPEEIGFILRNADRYLAMPPKEEDILSVFAGQRPLVRPPGRDGTATKSISRNHEVLISESGLITIVGGKWTTYRKMAEDTVNQALLVGGFPELPCKTSALPLHGACEPSAEPPRNPLLSLYGADAPALEQLMREQPELSHPLHPHLPYPAACVIWAARQEMARTVEDVLARRTRALFLNSKAAIECAPATACLLAHGLGRNREWEQNQVRSFFEKATRCFMVCDAAG